MGFREKAINVGGSLQLTLGDAGMRGEVDAKAPMWVLVFPDGRCMYRDVDGDIVPALSLSQVLATASNLSVDDYHVGQPFENSDPGWPHRDGELDDEGGIG